MARKPMGLGLIVIGAVLLTMGSLGVIGTIILDTTPPLVDHHYPFGIEGAPNPFTYGEYITMEVLSRDASVISCSVTITSPNGAVGTANLNRDPTDQTRHYRNLLIDQYGYWYFEFEAKDAAGWSTFKSGIGWAGATPEVEWYFNNQFLGAGGTIYITTVDIAVRAEVSVHAAETTTVWLAATKDDWSSGHVFLTEAAIGTWEGTLTLDQGDGSYTIKGYTVTAGTQYNTLLTVVGLGGFTAVPVSWITWFSVGIIAVGLIMITTGSATSKKKGR